MVGFFVNGVFSSRTLTLLQLEGKRFLPLPLFRVVLNSAPP